MVDITGHMVFRGSGWLPGNEVFVVSFSERDDAVDRLVLPDWMHKPGFSGMRITNLLILRADDSLTIPPADAPQTGWLDYTLGQATEQPAIASVTAAQVAQSGYLGTQLGIAEVVGAIAAATPGLQEAADAAQAARSAQDAISHAENEAAYEAALNAWTGAVVDYNIAVDRLDAAVEAGTSTQEQLNALSTAAIASLQAAQQANAQFEATAEALGIDTAIASPTGEVDTAGTTGELGAISDAVAGVAVGTGIAAGALSSLPAVSGAVIGSTVGVVTSGYGIASYTAIGVAAAGTGVLTSGGVAAVAAGVAAKISAERQAQVLAPFYSQLAKDLIDNDDYSDVPDDPGYEDYFGDDDAPIDF